MPKHQHDGAAAPGQVTPTSDNAPWQARVEGEQEATDGRILGHTHKRSKDAETLRARAALLGMVAEPLPGGAWRVAAGSGSTVHPSQQSVQALVTGIEQVRAEVGALVRSGRPAAVEPSQSAAPPGHGAVDRARFARLQARAAAHGITVGVATAESGAEVFYASRWSFTKELPDLAAVEAFLRRQGVLA